MNPAPLNERDEAKQQAVEVEQREMKRLLRGVSRRNPIRRLVDAATGELIDAPDAAARLCAILRDSPAYRWRERTTATLALRQIAMTPTQARYAARVLGDIMNSEETLGLDAHRKRSLAEARHTAGLVGAIIAGVFLMGFTIQTGIMPEWLHQVIFNFGLLLLGTSLLWLPALILLEQRRQIQMRIEGAVTLRTLKLPESVRAMAVLAHSRKYYVSIAQEALIEILPLLTPEHYGRLETATVPELCLLLRNASVISGLLYPAPLCEAVLNALAKIGDGRAVKPVQKFAEKCPVPSLRTKAAEVLPILLERKAREEAPGILLRGASAPAAPGKELLRAASSAPETAPELLLRASQQK